MTRILHIDEFATHTVNEMVVSYNSAIRQFIENNNLIWNQVTKSYDCNGDVRISNDIVIDGKLKIRFGKVGGDFSCFHSQVTTLEGAPNKVDGDFYCDCNELTTLKGAPQKVDGDFSCSNNKLTTLKGAPQKVDGDFSCRRNKLATIEDSPQEVGRNFICGDNPNLVLLKKKPSFVKGKIYK